MLRRPIDQVRRILIRTHKQNLLLTVQIDNLVLDPRRVPGEKEIEDRINVFFKRDRGLILLIIVEEDDALGAALGDVFVFALLGTCEIVIFVKEGPGVECVGFLGAGFDDSDSAAGDFPET